MAMAEVPSVPNLHPCGLWAGLPCEVALALDPDTKRVILIVIVAIVVIGGGLGLLIWGGTQRGQVAWDNPVYHRDPKAPKICMCYWMRSAFRVPCEDIPAELLKESK